MKKKLSLKTTTLFIAVLAATLLFAHSAQSTTLEVGAGKPYATIQSAIDNANAGDTVLVYDGIYVEDINFNSNAITVESVNGPVVTTISGTQNAPSGFVVTMNSGGSVSSVLNGFTVRNGSSYAGGGIGCLGSSIVNNCIVTKNSGGIVGYGIYSAYSDYPNTISNCVIYSNSATNGGGIGIAYAHTNITNCTIYGNSFTTSGAGIMLAIDSSANVVNSIVWGNTIDEIAANNNEVSVSYSDVEGGWDGTGNIDLEPLFIDPATGDFHLQADSPCRDSGTSVGAPASDIKGTTRPQGSGYDMGAYEYAEPISTTTTTIIPTPAITPYEGTNGTKITITGTGFGENKKDRKDKGNKKEGDVFIGDNKCKVTYWSDTKIEALVAHITSSGDYDITVVPKGGVPIVCPERFTIKAAFIGYIIPRNAHKDKKYSKKDHHETDCKKFYMSGYYFGTDGDLKVLITSLPLGTGKVMDANVSDSNMDSVSGLSSCTFSIELKPGSYSVMVKNKVESSATVDILLTQDCEIEQLM
jgi:hypothetical protein